MDINDPLLAPIAAANAAKSAAPRLMLFEPAPVA